MGEYDNNLRGVLFKNNTNGNESAPWYKGFAEIGGVKYEMAAWLKESKKDGSKFLSIKFENKQGQPQHDEPPSPDMGDIPF